MTPYGLGPITLSDVYFNPSSVLPRSSLVPWIVLEGALVGLAGIWIPIFVGQWRALPSQRREIALFGICLAGLTFLASVQAYLYAIFDRYHFQSFLGLCVAVPILLSSKFAVDSARIKKVLLAFGIPWLLWSSFWIAAQHDYLAWNPARWKLADRAKQSGISLRELDGGYELGGWLAFEDGRPNAGDPDCGIKQMWFCGERRFRIGLNRDEGHREVMREQVQSWLRNIPDLLLLERR
jgi:hypothetical protein